MDIELIKSVLDQLNNSDIKYLEYKDDESSLKIIKNNISLNLNKKVREQIACTKQETDNFEIKSIYVGIVVIINNKTGKPFVNLGQVINKGDLLCIIEFLNQSIEIRSPYSGILNDICIKNNEFVDYGKILFLIID